MEKEIRRIAIYARQSVEKKDSVSLETQIEKCKEKVDARDLDCVTVYQDPGCSGKDTNRPQFLQLMSDVRNGLISAIIVYRLDRISRSVLDFANMLEEFMRYDVVFVSATEEAFNTRTSDGNQTRFMMSITMTFAQFERETIQKRIKDNFYARIKSGKGMGGPAPYGYTRVSKVVNGENRVKVMEQDENAYAVRLMYDLYGVQNYSLSAIARYLNERSIKPPKSESWDSCRVSRLLQNPCYVKATPEVYEYYSSRGCEMTNEPFEYLGTNGLYFYCDRSKLDSPAAKGNKWGWGRDENGAATRRRSNKFSSKYDGQYVTLGLHEGIIDADVWLSCQRRIDQNEQINNEGAGKHSWLTSMIKCGVCGHSLCVVTSKYGQYKYFRCSGLSRGVCESTYKAVKVEDVERIVEQQLFSTIRQYADVRVELNNQHKARMNRLEAQRIKLESEIANIIKYIAEGGVKLKQFDDALRGYEAKIHEINVEISELGFSHRRLNQRQMIDTIEQWPTLSPDMKRQIAKQFIGTITLSVNEEETVDVAIEMLYDFRESIA